MSDTSVRTEPGAPPRARRAGPVGAVVVCVLAAAAAVLVGISLYLLIQGSGRGLDPTDESTYLLATHPRHPGAGFNGLFGYYTGLLLSAVGNDLARFRIAGYLLLGAAFAGAGHALGRLVVAGPPRRPALVDRGLRVVIALGAAAGGLLNYSIFLRTPSYNWLALLGTALAVHGLVRAVLGEVTGRRAWATAVLVAGGCFLAVWGKSTTGAVLTVAALVVLLAVPGSARLRLLVLARITAVGCLLLALHFVFVLGPGDTLAAYRRSARVLATVDPGYYSVRGALRHSVDQLAALPGQLISVIGPWLAFLLVPLAALAFPGVRRGAFVRIATASAAAALGLLLLRTDLWQGGLAGYGSDALAAVAVLLVALLGWALVAAVGRVRQTQHSRVGARPAVVALLLVVVAGAYAFGSNNGFVPQLTGAVGLILLAAAVLAAAPPRRPAPPGPDAGVAPWAAAVVALLICVAAPVVIGEARSAPYRILPLAADTVPVDLGHYGGTVAVDPGSAASYRTVLRAAREQGWQPGTPLLDLSFTPALALMMDADVPLSLLPLVGGFPSGTSSTLTSLSYQDRSWSSRAWLLVDPSSRAVHVGPILRSLGRSLDRDYVPVVTAPRPAGSTLVLYRPRSH